MANLILQYHNFRHLKPDDKNELIVLFHLSLMPESAYKEGQKPGQDDSFWMEVHLDRFLAERPGWAKLTKDDKVKVMFQHAVEQIQQTHRKLRDAHLFWTANGANREAPKTAPSSIEFPTAKAITIECPDGADDRRLQARAGAGL